MGPSMACIICESCSLANSWVMTRLEHVLPPSAMTRAKGQGPSVVAICKDEGSGFREARQERRGM